MQVLYEKQDGVCRWCPTRCVIPDRRMHGVLPDDTATFDHLDDRFSHPRTDGGPPRRVVMACFRCNQERGRARYIEMIPLEQRRENYQKYARAGQKEGPKESLPRAPVEKSTA